LNVEVIYNIALYHAKKEDFSCAKEYLDTIVNLYCGDNDLKIRILILQSNILLRQNEHKKALEILEWIINLDKNLVTPYHYIIYNNMGICFNYLGDYENSIRCLNETIKLQLNKNSPNLTNSLIHASKVHINMSQDNIAIRFIEAAHDNAIKFEQAKYIFECYELMYSILRNKNKVNECYSLIEKCKQTIIDYKLEKSFNYRYCVINTDYYISQNDLKSAKVLLDNIINRKEMQ